MNLASYMAMTVTPLSAYTPPCEQRQAEVQKRKAFNWKRNTGNANVAKQDQAIASYRAVMGTEWVKTRTIEDRLGYTRSSSLETLMKWRKEGLVARRPVGGGRLIPRVGYEWRFVR